jgi:hypothetical protein
MSTHDPAEAFFAPMDDATLLRCYRSRLRTFLSAADYHHRLEDWYGMAAITRVAVRQRRFWLVDLAASETNQPHF